MCTHYLCPRAEIFWPKGSKLRGDLSAEFLLISRFGFRKLRRVVGLGATGIPSVGRAPSDLLVRACHRRCRIRAPLCVFCRVLLSSRTSGCQRKEKWFVQILPFWL